MNDAKPLTPEEQAVLDALEPSVEVQCAIAEQTVPHFAEVALKCRECGQAWLLVCKHHAQAYAAHLLAQNIVTQLNGGIPFVECVACHATRENLDDLVEVVHL